MIRIIYMNDIAYDEINFSTKFHNEERLSDGEPLGNNFREFI